MATGLYFGTDERVKGILDSFFEERLKATGESHALIQVNDEQKFGEALAGLAFDMLFIEEGILPLPPNEWLASTRKTKPELKAPMVLVGNVTLPQKVIKFIEAGWKDYLQVPPDRPLVIEKFWMHASGKRSGDIRQVYTMAMKEPTTLAKVAEIEELSEFDCKVKCHFELPLDEVLVLYSNAFAIDEGTEGQILARCYQIVKGANEGEWQASFYFIGATDEQLKAIRAALRRSYVAGKR